MLMEVIMMLMFVNIFFIIISKTRFKYMLAIFF